MNDFRAFPPIVTAAVTIGFIYATATDHCGSLRRAVTRHLRQDAESGQEFGCVGFDDRVDKRGVALERPKRETSSPKIAPTSPKQTPPTSSL